MSLQLLWHAENFIVTYVHVTVYRPMERNIFRTLTTLSDMLIPSTKPKPAKLPSVIWESVQNQHMIWLNCQNFATLVTLGLLPPGRRLNMKDRIFR